MFLVVVEEAMLTRLKPILRWIAVVIVTLVGMEVSARLFISVRQRDAAVLLYGLRYSAGTAGLSWRPPEAEAEGGYAPGVYQTTYRHQNVTIRINQRGLRGPEFDLSKAKGVFRVVLVGESSTFGAESSEGQTIRDYLEQGLGEIPRRVEVLNAGRPGAMSDGIARRVRNELLGYQPDAIVLCMGYNDIDRFLYYDNPLYRLGPKFVRGVSFLYNTAITSASIWQVRTAYRDEAGVTNYLERFRRNVTDIVQSSRAAGVRLLLVTQPIRLKNLEPQSRVATLATIRQAIARGDALPAAGTILYLHELEQQTLRTIAAEQRVGLADAIARFETLDPERLFYDIVHLTPEGNQVVADVILAGLESESPD